MCKGIMQFQKRKTLSYSTQWYLWIYRNVQIFFRKSMLVGYNTLIWLRIRPPMTTDKKITTVVDQLTKFETPIKKRFLSLFSADEKIQTSVSESSHTINTRNLPVQLIFNDFWHFCTVTLLQSLVFSSYKEDVNSERNGDQGTEASMDISKCSRWSSGIEPCFYNLEEYTAIMLHTNNDLEKNWRSRMLYVATPYGNVMMYYDAFKQGFAYYCDRMGLNYRLLNAVAMKYVMTFRCVDFFVDETIFTHNPSPFLVRFKQTEQMDKEKKQKNMQILLGSYSSEYGKTDVEIGNSPFVKSRPVVQVKDNNPVVELYRNKFLYMGKICNATWLQKIKRTLPRHSTSGRQCNTISDFVSVDKTDCPSETMMPIISASSLFKTMYNDSAANIMNYKSYKALHM
jgi:hypothetical protein